MPTIKKGKKESKNIPRSQFLGSFEIILKLLFSVFPFQEFRSDRSHKTYHQLHDLQY